MLQEHNLASSVNPLIELVSLYKSLEKANTKNESIGLLLETLKKIFPVKFISFVQKKGEELNVVSQIGDSSSVVNIFDKKSSEQIFEWVINQGRYVFLGLAQGEKFVFIPVIETKSNAKIIHGIIVVNLSDPSYSINAEINSAIELFTKIASIFLAKISEKSTTHDFENIKQKIKTESSMLLKLQKAISGDYLSNKFLFRVLEDEAASFNGNVWWVGNLGTDIALVMVAQILCRGLPSAMLGGYLLGEMNILKTNAEIALYPFQTLKFLNQQLHPIFVASGITFNVWYGVFNLEARKVRFGNANHPEPFLIGSEQQVSTLSGYQKSQALGISLNTNFVEHDLYLSSGSKLVICTKELLEQAAKVGNKYDPTWLPQVLETIGSLSLTEMKKSLDNILSENMHGTAQESSRLSLLLEVGS